MSQSSDSPCPYGCQRNQKHLAGALLFTVFLGPIGLLYASTRGGIIMILLGLIVCTHPLPIPLLFIWLISCIWSVCAVNHYNQKICRKLL